MRDVGPHEGKESAWQTRTIRGAHADDFKRQIVGLCNGGKPVGEIMADHGLGRSTVRRWINSINAIGSPRAADNRTPEQQRIADLERENERLRMENDVLKQAAPIFARKRR